MKAECPTCKQIAEQHIHDVRLYNAEREENIAAQRHMKFLRENIIRIEKERDQAIALLRRWQRKWENAVLGGQLTYLDESRDTEAFLAWRAAMNWLDPDAVREWFDRNVDLPLLAAGYFVAAMDKKLREIIDEVQARAERGESEILLGDWVWQDRIAAGKIALIHAACHEIAQRLEGGEP